MCPTKLCQPQGSSSSSESSSQELPGVPGCLCLPGSIPSAGSRPQMPFPGSPAKHHPHASSATAAAPQRPPVLGQRCHPAPGRAASWAPPPGNWGAGDVLGTPWSPPSPPPESMDCNKRPGFYYDDLVKNCIKCSSVCGQHPRECALSCERESGKGSRNPLLVPGSCTLGGCHHRGWGKAAGASPSRVLHPTAAFPCRVLVFLGWAAPPGRVGLAVWVPPG